MSLEIEAKLKVNALDPIRMRLTRLMANHVGFVREVNIFFDRPERSLQQADRGLRVRLETTSEDSLPRAVMTSKGPRQNSRLQPRESYDLQVCPPYDAQSFLESLGYVKTLSYQKNRESWTLDGCKVELDELPYLGTFVEIEGPSEEAVTKVIDKLEMGHFPLERASYVQMMAEHCRKHNITDMTVTFPVNDTGVTYSAV